MVHFDDSGSAFAARLMSLGLIPGTEFTVLHVAPLGDPVAIQIRGFRLSLRADEACGLQLEKL